MKVATVELSLAGTHRVGRALLDRDLLATIDVAELERRFAVDFADEEDEARLAKIEKLLRMHKSLLVDVLLGETGPQEYHVYFLDHRQTRLFACVLAPEAVTETMLREPPYLLFENATFQAMGRDTSPGCLRCAVETWARRIFPHVDLPAFKLIPPGELKP